LSGSGTVPAWKRWLAPADCRVGRMKSILQPAHSPARDVIEREFQVHYAVMPPGLIETGSILTTINLIRKSPMVGVISATVARRDAEHGVLSIVQYVIRHKLSTYGSIVRSDRPLSLPAKQFLELLHRRR
jgi:DNA-binding transcriptional LysR family regulator